MRPAVTARPLGLMASTPAQTTFWEVEAMPQLLKNQLDRSTTARECRYVAWAGLALTTIGVAGFLLVPSLSLIWLIFTTFGVSTVPQVAFSWIDERRARSRASSRTR